MPRIVASLIVFSTAFAVAPLTCSATPITFNFTGVVSSVSLALGTKVSAGELIVGDFTFESSTADSDPGDPKTGTFNNVITAFTATFGGNYTVTQGLTDSVTVLDGPAGNDVYQVLLESPTASTLSGLDLTALFIDLVDVDSTIFATDALPTTPPDLALIDVDLSNLIFMDSPTNQVVKFELTSLTVVPEPSSLALAALGFVTLSVWRWRWRKR